MNNKFNLVVCSSGEGGNFQSIIDAQTSLGISVSTLIVDRQCGAIHRAKAHSIPVVVLDTSKGKDSLFLAFEASIPDNTDLIVLAGFMPILPSNICDKWKYRIINTHPSLLPKYGGKGMYGVKVQEAVMKAKDEEAGCTVHYVSRDIDGGEIILQKKIKVDYAETPWQLGGRIFKEENRLLVEAIRLVTSRLAKSQDNKNGL